MFFVCSPFPVRPLGSPCIRTIYAGKLAALAFFVNILLLLSIKKIIFGSI